jgi:hypothetical protein
MKIVVKPNIIFPKVQLSMSCVSNLFCYELSVNLTISLEFSSHVLLCTLMHSERTVKLFFSGESIVLQI